MKIRRNWRFFINPSLVRCVIVRFFFLSIAVMPSVALATEQQGFTVKGRLRYENIKHDGTTSVWTRDFKVTVQGCEWIVESTDVASGEYNLNTRLNGLTHYVTKVNPNHDPSLNDYYEVIDKDEVPTSDLSGTPVLWLAFASGCYLETAKSNRYRPIWMLDDPNLRKEGFAMDGILDSMEGGLPGSLFYLNKGVIYAQANGQRIAIRAPASFQGAVTNAFYRAIEKTNLGFMEIPKSFEFQRFAITPKFTTGLLTKVSGLVTHVALIEQLGNELPELKGVMFVNDKRYEKAFSNEIPIMYRATNSIMFPATNPTLVDQKKVALSTQAILARQKSLHYSLSQKRLVIISIFVLVSALPALFVLKTTLMRKKYTNPNHK